MKTTCSVCKRSILVDEPMPSATYMCQTCEAANRPAKLQEADSITHAIASKKHDKTVDVFISTDRVQLMKMFSTWKAAGNKYDRIAQGDVPSKLPADKIRQRMAQQFGVPMEKIEVHFLDKPNQAQSVVKEAGKPFTQGDHVILLAIPKNPSEGDGKGYWKVGTEVFRAPVKNVMFDASGAPMDKRWESSFTHFMKNFDSSGLGQYYKKAPTWTPDLHEAHDDILAIVFESIHELQEAAEYQGRKVKLGKPFRTPGGPKKFSVYVKNDKGNVVKVNFGDPKLSIKRDDPERRKNFRARHGCDNPGPRWKAKYWSCRFWSKKSVTDLVKETTGG